MWKILLWSGLQLFIIHFKMILEHEYDVDRETPPSAISVLVMDQQTNYFLFFNCYVNFPLWGFQ